MEIVEKKGLGACSCGPWTRVLLTDGVLWACSDVLEWDGTVDEAVYWAHWFDTEAEAREEYGVADDWV